jgi:hypothetical protein
LIVDGMCTNRVVTYLVHAAQTKYMCTYTSPRLRTCITLRARVVLRCKHTLLLLVIKSEWYLILFCTQTWGMK